MIKRLRITEYPLSARFARQGEVGGLIRNSQFEIIKSNQSGQTLIETIIAISVLTLALTSGLALAIFSLSSTSRGYNQMVATNLAREGIEVVRMMRDSNWLAGDAKGGAWDLTTCSDIGNRFCYPRAYQQVPSYNGYDLSTGYQRINFNPSSKEWTISNPNNFNLYLQDDGAYTHQDNNTRSVYARQIYIQKNTTAPYSAQNDNMELIVRVAVAWRGKECPDFSASQDLIFDSNLQKCRVILEEHMTNWKDYK